MIEKRVEFVYSVKTNLNAIRKIPYSITAYEQTIVNMKYSVKRFEEVITLFPYTGYLYKNLHQKQTSFFYSIDPTSLPAGQQTVSRRSFSD